jgi:phosphopantetheinyl transferase (holo-ACP synthase)
MNEIQWKKFIELWENGSFEDAVNIQLEEQQRGGIAVVDRLFRNQKATSTVVTGISFIDVIYDYLMVNPNVIKSVDFARSEDLASFFTFQQFATSFNFENTGELTRLKGYTAEHLVALELQGKGHEVGFPSTSNQVGYDLIVDGQPFQVKCLNNPTGVYEHFRQYPEIPVLVNQELASSLENNPLVYGTNVSNITVEELTKSTLEHAAEITDLEIPIITLGVTSLTNGYKVITDGLSFRLAGMNVANETASRGMAGMIGKGTGILIGPLFGPAGVVVLPIVMGLGGAFHGKKLTKFIKKLYTQKEKQQVLYDLEILLSKLLSVFPKKELMRKSTFQTVLDHIKSHFVLKNIHILLEKKYKEKQIYTQNKRDELNEYLIRTQKDRIDLETEVQHILDTVLKSQIHPFLYQKELTSFAESYKTLMKI